MSARPCVGAVGHNAWLILEELGHAAHPVAPALGVVAVEVPQVQFLHDETVGYWWACWWFDSGYMAASAPGCLWMVFPHFPRDGILGS